MDIIGTVKSSSGEGSYTVARGADGVVYCSCPAWRFQRLAPAARSCKHIRALSASVLGKKDATPMSKSEAGHGLSTAVAKTAARKSAHALHKALKAGGEGAVEAAKMVLADTDSGYSARLKALALATLAVAGQ